MVIMPKMPKIRTIGQRKGNSKKQFYHKFINDIV